MTNQLPDVEAFCRRVRRAEEIWALARNESIFAVGHEDGGSVMPFWSSRERALEYRIGRPDLDGLGPLVIPLSVFRRVWLTTTIPVGMELGIDWIQGELLCIASRDEVMRCLEEAGT